MSDPAETVVKVSVIPVQDYTWTYNIKAGDSKVKSELRYKDDFKDWGSRCPVEGSEHPEIANLVLIEIKAAREEGDVISIHCSYESANPDATYPGRPDPSEKSQERFHSDPSLNDEPLLSHPQFKALLGPEKQALITYQNSARTEEDYDKAKETELGDTAIFFLDAIAEGQDSWKAPQMVWIRKRIIQTLNEIDIDKIGKIDNPPKDTNGHPNTPDGRNWLYLAPDIAHTANGLAYEVVEYWQLSYEGGWKEFLYKAD
jgi:hypothetical protein